MAVYVVMTLGRLPLRAADARRGRRAGREPRQPVGPVAIAPRACRGDRHLHVQPRRDPAVVRLLAQAAGVPGGGRCRADLRSRSPASSAPWSGPIITSRSSRSCISTPPAEPYAKAKAPVETGLICSAAIAVIAARLSAHRSARQPDRQGRRDLVLRRSDPHPLRRATGSTNADLLADAGGVEGDWLVARAPVGGAGPAGPPMAVARRQFRRHHAGHASCRRPAAADAALAAGLALIEAVQTAAPGRRAACSNGPTI